MATDAADGRIFDAAPLRCARPVSAVPKPNLPDIATDEIQVESALGAKSIRVLAYRPVTTDQPLPVILHIHGGGLVMGTPEMKDVENGRLVHRRKHRIHNGCEPCDILAMAQTACILLGGEDRVRLAALVGDRNRLQRHVQRARIVLLSADRLPALAVVRQTGASRPAVWRRQQRFAEQGVDGLLRDKTRKPGKQPLPATPIS